MDKPQLRTISAAEYNRIKSGKDRDEAIQKKMKEVTSSGSDWSLGGIVSLIGLIVLILGSCSS